MTAIPENKKIRKEQIKGVVKSIQAGTNVTIDASNEENPIVNASGGGVQMVTGNLVDNTDPDNPIVSSFWGFQDPELVTPSDVDFTGFSSTGHWFRTGNIVLYHFYITWSSATVNVNSDIRFTLPSDALPSGEIGFYTAGMSSVLAMGIDFDTGHTYTGMQADTTLTMRLCSSGSGISTIDFIQWDQITGGNGQLRGTIMLGITLD